MINRSSREAVVAAAAAAAVTASGGGGWVGLRQHIKNQQRSCRGSGNTSSAGSQGTQ